MKKFIILLVGIVGSIFTSCDPLDDIYDEIAQAGSTPIVGDAEYTVTDDDYDALDLSYGSFNSLDEAKTLIPGLLEEEYPVWGKGSSVLVDFDLYVGNAEGVSAYTSAATNAYTLANADYPGATDNAVGFYPEENAVSLIPSLLSEKIAEPTEGQHAFVKYKQYVGETVLGVSNFLESDFKTEQTLIDYTTVSVVGDQVWTGTQYGATMNGYLSGSGAQANEDWLISPVVDLTGKTNPILQVTQILNYATGMLDQFKVLASTDYDGDVTTATWDTIELTNTPTGDNWTAFESDGYDFSAYEDKKVTIAFKYVSTTAGAATWEIVKVVVKVPGVEGELANKEMFFTYSGGAWEPSEGVYYVTSEDFDSMGEASGQPGRYDNFGSTMPPDNYLPTFLSSTSPYSYGQDGDELIVVYPYYSSSSGAQIRGNLYSVVDGEWVGYQSTQSTTLQFGHDGTTWVPDNTIKYTLTNADYEYIGEVLGSDPEYSGIVATLTNYHDYDSSWSDEQILYSLFVLAEHNFPDAEIGQKYEMTYLVYSGGTSEKTASIILTTDGWAAQ